MTEAIADDSNTNTNTNMNTSNLNLKEEGEMDKITEAENTNGVILADPQDKQEVHSETDSDEDDDDDDCDDDDDDDYEDSAEEKAEEKALAERQAMLETRAINEATASADSMYVPSPSLLSSSSPLPLLEQIDGPSLKDYNANPNVYLAHGVPLAAGAKFEVPIHITTGGSVVEYTVESEKNNVTFGITAEREEKETVVKALELVDAHIKPVTGKFLVGTVPCVLVFTYDNLSSWITEKKITYKIVVTPPSKQNILLGRRRRAASALKAVEVDRSSASNRLASARKEKDILTASMARLEKELAKQKESLEVVNKEESFLQSRVQLRTTQCDMLNDRLNNGWEDES